MTRCESCGMPLNDGSRGTEADGAASATYCATCYTKGAFTLADATMEDVRKASIAAMVKQGVPPLAASKLTENIIELPRWR